MTENAGDSDDTNSAVYAGAPELEDALDNDCDGIVDEGTGAYDDDGDGMSENAGDCNDADSSIYAGAPELLAPIHICRGRRIEGGGDSAGSGNLNNKEHMIA